MIDQNTYASDWIRGIAQQLGKRGDPKLVEKVLYAFGLLEHLKQAGLGFIFKGGTSLLLLSNPTRRFSIDIDIIFEGTNEKIESGLDAVVAMGRFSHWVADNDRKRATDAPVGHYKLYYTSTFDTTFGEEPILLDVLYSENPYPALVERPVQHQWLQTSGDLTIVRIPAINSILGDKLTAFAPNTTGIPYTKNRPVEIIKQLFDVAFLFDLATDFNVVRNAYIRNAEEEINFRKLALTYDDALADTLITARLIAERDTKREEFIMLQKGISNIGNYILTPFRIEEAIVCGGKAAYLSRIIATETEEVMRYTEAADIAEWIIENPAYNKLNKLKKSNPEAFFYWYQAQAI